MAVWRVLPGTPAREALALENGLAVIGFQEVPNLAPIHTQTDLVEILEGIHPEAKRRTVTTWAGELWAFRERIQSGDLVVVPLKGSSTVGIARVTGPYQFRTDLAEDVHHVRPVEWLKSAVPRIAFGQDLLFSFGSLLAICQVERNNAEQRIESIAKGQEETPRDEGEALPPDEVPIDLPQYARDEIKTFISVNFKGHALANLVAEVLRSQGFHTLVSPPGPDRGVDILAGRGHMGFDQPRFCVQVKSGDTRTDVTTVRELTGVMNNHKASQGLLVSWSGYTRDAISEAKNHYFEVRLWDADDLVDTVLQNYERFSPESSPELRLKRVRTLVREE